MALAALLTACEQKNTVTKGVTESWDNSDTVNSQRSRYSHGIVPVIIPGGSRTNPDAAGTTAAKSSAGAASTSGAAVHSVSSRGGFGYNGHYSAGS